MYKVRIKTLYNVINLEVEDPNSPEMQEIYDQPYVVEIYIESKEHGIELKRERKAKNDQ